jgi:hypothetical protein
LNCDCGPVQSTRPNSRPLICSATYFE